MAIQHTRLGCEELESRRVLSLTVGLAEMGNPWGGPGGPNRDGDDGDEGGDDPTPTVFINLEAVALHEIGHALGLEHVKGGACAPVRANKPVMCGSYSGATALTATDEANIQALYLPAGDTFTYSFVNGVVNMPAEGVNSESFDDPDGYFPSDWQTAIDQAFNTWEAAGANLTLNSLGIEGSPSVSGGGIDGATQGQIRLFAHYIDGPLGVLGHAYLPETFSTGTLNQDIHFDTVEGWNLPSSLSTASFSASINSNGHVVQNFVYSPSTETTTVGDVNFDGLFNQRDLVQVLQAGKYMTEELADRTDGDWNQDGYFNQLDVVYALQQDSYTGSLVNEKHEGEDFEDPLSLEF